ncbi:MAG TPA: hypothetical protein VGR34_06450 [Candidatus Dormibacteraeota bacterium]|nr:hypothetical protein [Candidatus Dormibacteraeota bacterium]
MKLPLWYPSEDLDAQFAHALAGTTTVFGAEVLWPGHGWIGLTGIFVFAALKEFIFDAIVEAQPFTANLRDFGFYMLGAGISTAAVLLKGCL